MDHFQKYSAHSRIYLSHRALASPLPKIVSLAIKHHNAAVAVAIRDINVAIGRVNSYISRTIQELMTGIHRVARSSFVSTIREVGGIEFPLYSDL